MQGQCRRKHGVDLVCRNGLWKAILALFHSSVPSSCSKRQSWCWVLLQGVSVRDIELPADSRDSVLLLGASQQENTESEDIAGNPSPCFFLLDSLQQGASVSSPWSSRDSSWEVSTSPKAPGLLFVPKQGVEGGGQGGQEDTQPVPKPGSSPDLAWARRRSQRLGWSSDQDVAVQEEMEGEVSQGKQGDFSLWLTSG